MDVHDLPHLNAALNALSVMWLILGFRFIRSGRREAHRRAMLTALATSACFLVSYLVYHANVGSTPFRSQGGVRILYFTILVSHSILAAVIVPLVGWTVLRALQGRFQAHRRWARRTWPLWVYVSVTGVLVYWMLYHLDPALRGSPAGS
jgi:uncharacterized membrane protein YozB (DUF420 family)